MVQTYFETPLDFPEYLTRLDVLENSKIIYDQFLQNGFHDR